MIEKDLESSFSLSEFGISAIHSYDESQETLNVIFDEITEVVLNSTGQGESYLGMESQVPSLTIATSEALNVTHRSFFEIDSITYEVLEISKQNDGTSKIYLEKQ